MKNRIVIIDWMKAICAIFVIMAHSLHTNLADQTNIFFLLSIENPVPVFMILSGLTFTLKYNEYTLSCMFDLKDIIKKILRFTIPMLFAYFAYLIYLGFQGKLSLYNAIKTLVICDFGKGAYYYALMIEFIFIAPFIFVVIRKMQGKGVFVIAGINLVFEILCRLVSLRISVYRVLIFRYLTMIGCGMYAFYLLKNKDGLKFKWIDKILILTSFSIGVFYKLLPRFGYTYHLFISKLWGRTSMISALYVFPLVMYVLFRCEGCRYISKFNFAWGVGMVGQASYHIMYAQMVYFVYRPVFDKYIFDVKKVGMPIEIIINLIVCLFFGVCFFLIDKKFLTGKIIHKGS